MPRDQLSGGSARTGVTAQEVVDISIANIGIDWTIDGCIDFVWGVTNLAGAPFFDLRDLTTDGNPTQPQDVPYVVPHSPGILSGAGDAAGDGWSLVFDGVSAADLRAELQAGDVVRVYRLGNAGEASLDPNGGYAAHSFIVASVDGEDVQVIDNWNTPGIIQHSLDDIISAFAPGGDFQSAFVSRLDESFAAENFANDLSGNGFGDFSEVAASGSPGNVSVIKLADLDGSNGFRIEGIGRNVFSGWSVAGAGDVNDDGYDDLLIGALSGGRSYVVFGAGDGFGSSLDLANLDGSNGFRIDGVGGLHIGRWVSGAGDFNGDGNQDLIVGARTYLVFGVSGGFGESLDLANLDGSNGFGIDVGDYVSSVSGAGDVNGDGYDDLIIGAEYADADGKFMAGESYVIFGSSGGFAASLDLADLDGSNGFRIDGINVYDRSGSSVSGAGDVNGDGFDDLIIGAPIGDPYYPNPNGSQGYVIFGSSGGFPASLDLADLDGSNGFRIEGLGNGGWNGPPVSGAGDVNGDGYDDLIIGAASSNVSYVVFGTGGGFGTSIDTGDLDGSNGFRIDGRKTAVSGAGDVNGDGYDDLIIGTITHDDRAGRSFVIFGDNGGFEASLDLANLDGSNGFRIDGIDADDASGLSVAGAGDVNSDGYGDLIIGSRAGESYVVFGFSTTSMEPQNQPPILFPAAGVVTLEAGVPVSLKDLFTLTDPDGLDDVVSIEFADDTPGSDGGEFGKYVLQFVDFSARQVWVPEPRVPGEPYRLTLTPDQLDEQVGPFFQSVWNYLPSTAGTNTIQIEATDSAGNVSDPITIDFTVVDQVDPAPDLPDLTAFEWDLSGVDEQGNTFEGDLVFEMQDPVSGGYDLTGYFDWVANGSIEFTILFEGFLEDDGDILFSATELADPVQGVIAADYSAEFSGDFTQITGTATGDGIIPLSWQADRIEPTNQNPVASGTDLSVAAASVIPLAELFTWSDPDGSEDIVSFAVRDRTDRAGYLTLDGIRQTDGVLFDEQPIGDIDRWAFVAGASGESDEIGFNAIDAAGAFNSPSALATVTANSAPPENKAPVIVYPGLITVQAGATGVIHDLIATDDEDTEGEGGGLIFTRNPSPDQLKLGVDLYTGEITFNRNLDGSLPEDTNGDNVYELTVGVTDSDGLSNTVDLRVQVVPANKDADAAILEYLAKEVVYGRDIVSGLFDPANAGLLNRLGGLSSTDIEFTFEDESGTFLALAICKPGYNPILVFRGTQPNVADWAENFRTTGVGLQELNRGLDSIGIPGAAAESGQAPTLREWLFAQENLSITGHSQGGAQAQLAAWVKAKEAFDNGMAAEIAQVATFNSAGMTLTQTIIDSLPELFAAIPVQHSINAGDVVSLTGNSFLPGIIEYHDNSAGLNPVNAHTEYWVNDELRSLSTIRATPIVKLDGGPDRMAFSSDSYSPVAGDFGQDNEYQEFLNALLFKVGFVLGSAINIVADKFGIGIVRIESSSLPEPILSLNVGDFNFRGFVVNELVPALSSRGRLAEELATDNGDLIREVLSAAMAVSA